MGKIIEIGNIDTTQYVNTTNDQNIDGIKTFVKSPVIPIPTDSDQAANKNYVDSNLADKQDILTAGNGITINENTISSDAAIEDNGYGQVFFWNGSSSLIESSNKVLWQKIIDAVKAKGRAFVYVKSGSSEGIFTIYSGELPSSSSTVSFYGHIVEIFSEGIIKKVIRPMARITMTVENKVITVTSVANITTSTTQGPAPGYDYKIGDITSINTTTFLSPGTYGRKLAATCTGIPITFSEATPVCIETRTTYEEPNATYSPYIRQDLYVPSLDRHWYRIVNYAASNNITYGEWKEIDLAFEIIDDSTDNSGHSGGTGN